ncbi:hypothetical protein GCM10007392_04370 [Saccharospirillum salsuginis]|uniref:Uncharacterized protein n=1 Tax=Saccharospirillum salsuginis TaxID=418750 RepID=A0A918JZY7_9GAMM|nr:hypothetical protein GCM10007392_04370 [Saccharospirillum salsuginis]
MVARSARLFVAQLPAGSGSNGQPLATLAQTTAGNHPMPGVPIATGTGAIDFRTGIPGKGSVKFRVSGADKRLL